MYKLLYCLIIGAFSFSSLAKAEWCDANFANKKDLSKLTERYETSLADAMATFQTSRGLATRPQNVTTILTLAPGPDNVERTSIDAFHTIERTEVGGQIYISNIRTESGTNLRFDSPRWGCFLGLSIEGRRTITKTSDGRALGGTCEYSIPLIPSVSSDLLVIKDIDLREMPTVTTLSALDIIFNIYQNR